MRSSALWIWICLAVLPAPAPGQFLPGLEIDGENWTYAAEGGTTITGVLIRPAGDGPFPAVIISHGKGGTVAGFTVPKAREMANWGLVCIGPRYTHATDDPDFGDASQEGARPENMRRARACVEIARALPYVKANRIAAYGNSMGAFVSIQLAADLPDRVAVAAITAGGIVESGDWPAPTVDEAQSIRTPFCMLHGLADTTVPPERSERLRQVLDQNGVPNERRVYDGIGHNLHSVLSSEVYTRIRDWFTTQGLFWNVPGPATDRPRGLFVLDSRQGTPHNGGTLRDANLRSHDFIDGYALRAAWDFMEPNPGVYDFTIIDNILAKLPAGQKLSLIITPYEPAYVAAHAGVTTWVDIDRDDNPTTRAVPWDPYLRERRRALIAALAAHATSGTALRDNPLLLAVDPYLPGGHTGIRDPNIIRLRDLPGYTRAGFQAAVEDELRALTSEFPRVHVQIGFWKFTDTEGGTEAWEEVRQALLAKFNGLSRPRVGFFMENLAASRPAPGQDPVTGYPVTDYGAPLYLSQHQTWTAFQALTSWKQPFTGPDKVANASPGDGIRYGYETYGCRYFELYVSDVDDVSWQPELREWQRRIHGRNGPAPATSWQTR